MIEKLNVRLLRRGALLGATSVLTLHLAAAAQDAKPVETVVVTGTIIGGTSPISPITTLDPTELDQRGITTVQGALQSLVSNNGPQLTNSFSANGAFASGASGASLRGLSTNSTLVLFDGLRAAYYPLADDGQRNFVDLNTVPDDIVDHVEVLRDGASAAYGADAIAGVINIITKKEFQGLSTNEEGGISSRGDAAQFKLSATAGVGDLSSDHVNAYISGYYYHDDALRNSARPYPFNSSDGSRICYDGTCGINNDLNGVQTNGSISLSSQGNFIIRPYILNPDGTTTAVAGGVWQAADGCGPGTSYNLTPAQQAAHPTYPGSVCQYDQVQMNGLIQPAITRFGVSGHTAFELPNKIEGYVEANFLQDNVSFNYSDTPAPFYATAPAGIYYPQFSTSASGVTYAPGSGQLYLPVYVCSTGVNCSTAPDARLDPYNPFAAAGQVARLTGENWFAPLPHVETQDRSYRLAGDIHGSLLDNWTWDVAATAMHTDLTQTYKNFVYIQHLLDVIATGQFNFFNPAATPANVISYLYPQRTSVSTSDEDQLKATITAPLYKLPGGEMMLALGSSLSYEAVDDPSVNSDFMGPTQRYFQLNAFGSNGSRDVYSGYFEINAPIIEELALDASGRYDSYSSGQSHFSPKIGFIANPIKMLTFKGAYSEGFRIPSFAEANALPTTGYVTVSKSLYNNAYLSQYGCSLATYTTSCPAYINNTSYGTTTLASPNLKPETSRSWVFDAQVRPFDGVTASLTYYNIRKSGAITNKDCSAALTAYYAGGASVPGCTIIPGAPDINFPNAKPTVAFVQAPLVNANTIKTDGWDMSLGYDGEVPFVHDLLGRNVQIASTVNATYIASLETVFPDGVVERYDGTLGPFNLTAGTGTPKWKGTWSTTFTSGIYSFTGTLNYVSGYNLSAMDAGTGYKDCGLSNGNTPCNVSSYMTFDINAQVSPWENTDLYLTVRNVTDSMPPIDNVTYGANNYNPVVTGDGIVGRYFLLGLRFRQ